MYAYQSVIPVCGYVSAGMPEDADEQPLGTIVVPLPNTGGDLFGLVVRGHSMAGAGIRDGQVVLIRRQHTFHDGDIVVALIDGQATLKRIYRHNDGYLLEPENPDYSALFVTRRAVWQAGTLPRFHDSEGVRVLGLMVGLLSEAVFPLRPVN